jgi:hypothetical protein
MEELVMGQIEIKYDDGQWFQINDNIGDKKGWKIEITYEEKSQ